MPRILTLDKSLSVLEAVFACKDGLGTRALAAQLDINVATAHNIARTFCQRGYLRQDTTSKLFYPGVRLILLGRHPSYLKSLSLTAAAIVDDVAERLNEGVLLASIDHGRILNLKYVPSHQSLRVQEPEDMSLHAHATAVGKVLLASLSDADLDSQLQKMPLKAYTPRTLATPERLREELIRIRAEGHSVTRDEFCEGVSAAAVPILDPWGGIIAAIGASAPTVRLRKPEQMEATLRELDAAARAIERQWQQSQETAAQPAPVRPARRRKTPPSES